MRLRCPGISGQRLTSTILRCSNCGAEVEIFSDESKARCPKCRTPVYKKSAPTCAKWCKAAAECMGHRAQDPKDTETTESENSPAES